MKHYYCVTGALVLLAMFAGCDRTESDWQKAVQTRTLAAYEEFRKLHPQSPHDKEAESAIEVMTAWTDAQKANDANGYLAFSEKYPDSDLAKEAIEKAKTLLFDSEPVFAKGFNPEGLENQKGGISLIATEIGIVAKSEGPDDGLYYSMGVGGRVTGSLGGGKYATGVGSVIRLGGSGTNWSVPSDERLIFKHTRAGWVFLCGRGKTNPGLAGEQTLGRSFSACLLLCDHPDPVVREGAARDLPRLCAGRSETDREKTVAALRRHLDDSNEDARNAARASLASLGG